MFDFISGKIKEITPTYVVLENSGMGYILNISLNTFDQIKGKDFCTLFCQLNFKVEASTPTGFVLYGFAEKNERELFQHLVSVSGVGSNTARTMLSALTPADIVDSILNSDSAVLQRIKGIGAKSAQRIVVDLKDKLGKINFGGDNLPTTHNTLKMETLSALSMLGYNRAQANKAFIKVLNQLEESEPSVELMVKECLKVL